MFKFLIAVVLIVGLVSCEKKPSGRVFFVSPQNGEEVRSPVAFKMGLEGMEIQPAGEVLPGKGHHHIIINVSPLPYSAVSNHSFILSPPTLLASS